MSTQQYYPPPNSYVPRAPVSQRQPAQYNPAGYNPAAYQQHVPPSTPDMNISSQPGHSGYNPGIYLPQHVGPPGRTTPQPVVGAGGYVPYANIQGVIGGVNRSVVLEQNSEEAPPPYSPPQRPFNRHAPMQPPTLTVPVNVQNNMYTPNTPSNSYQPVPQVLQPSTYPAQDQRRVTSPPNVYNPVAQQQIPQSQTPVQQSTPQAVPYASRASIPTAPQPFSAPSGNSGPLQRSITAPSVAGNRSPEEGPEPSSPQRNQPLPAIGAWRERDSLPLRRPPATTSNSDPSQPSTNRRATMPIPPPPPMVPPPPSAPPPSVANVGVHARRQTLENIPSTVTPSQNNVNATPVLPPTSTPTTGTSQLPLGVPLPPPPARPPPKAVLLQPVPLGKRKDKGRAVDSPGVRRIDDGGNDGVISSPPPSAPYSAGTLPFRRHSPTSTTPHSSMFPNSASIIQPQSIMRSQKSSGDLASGGLRTTTPKDVRFVIPDDESEYESTADGESQRNSAVEQSPGFAAAVATEPTTPRTPVTPGRRITSSQQITTFATIAEEDALHDDGGAHGYNGTKGKTSTRSNEKTGTNAKVASQAPLSAPSSDGRFHITPTPPFSPDTKHKEKERSHSISGIVIPRNQIMTPPMHSAPLEDKDSSSRNAGINNEIEDLDLPPFYHDAIERHTDMILTEATAANDEKRLNLFVDYVMEEARMRGEIYNNALGMLGPGLTIFPTDDPQFMTPEQEVAEYERREYERRVMEKLSTNEASSSNSPGSSGIKRQQTIKEQKARAGEYLENRRSRSNPSTPKESSKRISWFEKPESGVSEDEKHSSPTEESLKANEAQKASVPEPVLIDLQPLLSIVQPFPRQFPASDNSHPSLQKTRKAIAELKDLTVIHKLKFDFMTSVPRVQDEFAAEARARKAAHQDYSQRLFNEGRVTYEQMDKLTAEFEKQEGERKAQDLQKEFERYQKEVVTPIHTQCLDRIDRATLLVDGIQTDISSEAKANITIREGPELLEKLNIMRTLFETREQLHNEINILIADRDSRYKAVTIAPFLIEGDSEGIKEAEEFFADAAKQTEVAADKDAVERAKSFLDKVEKDVIKGVENEVSNFWDVAPTLTALLGKIPDDLSNFQPIIPEDELYGNSNYKNFPLLYLKRKLDYAGNSLYQHAQAQMRLLDFSVEITLLWTNAKWALGDSERVLAGEEEQRAVWQVERQKKEEEVRQTKNWEEKLKIVKEEWTQSVGNKLTGMKQRIIDQLSRQEGWANEYL